MRRRLVPFALFAVLTCTAAAQEAVKPAKGGQITLLWLGTAGWEIRDGSTIILIDPYISRIFGLQPPGRTPFARTPSDTRQLRSGDPTRITTRA